FAPALQHPRTMAFEEAHQRADPAAAFDPRGEAQQTGAAMRIVGEYEQHRPPIAWMLDLAIGGDQMVARLRQVIGALAVGPARPHRAALEIPEDGEDYRARDEAHLPVDRDHENHAAESSGQAEPQVVPAQARPEGRAGGARLVIGRVVDEAV